MSTAVIMNDDQDIFMSTADIFMLQLCLVHE